MSWLWLLLIVAVFGAFSGGSRGYRRDDREYPEPEYDYDGGSGDCCDE